MNEVELVCETLTHGFLIRIAEVLQAIKPQNIYSWRIKDFESGGGIVNGLSAPEISEQSDQPNGLVWTNDEFFVFVQADIDVWDGKFEAFANSGETDHGKFQLECHDSSTWILRTFDEELAQSAIATGLLVPNPYK